MFSCRTLDQFVDICWTFAVSGGCFYTVTCCLLERERSPKVQRSRLEPHPSRGWRESGEEVTFMKTRRVKEEEGGRGVTKKEKENGESLRRDLALGPGGNRKVSRASSSPNPAKTRWDVGDMAEVSLLKGSSCTSQAAMLQQLYSCPLYWV